MTDQTAKRRAYELHEEGEALSAAGDEEGALRKYFAALELDLARPPTLYNIGLIYKYRRQWQDSFRYNLRAAELDPEDEATQWNLAIAATALRDWRTARRIWHGRNFGIEPGNDPIDADFGTAPVRLNPDGEAEVVWGQRIDPVRLRIHSIPRPQSGFRYHDMVLHDGAPVGYRMHRGREYGVFNVFELFEGSGCATYEARVDARTREDLEALEAACEEYDTGFEDWTSSIRWLCRACSEGRPHEKHDHDEPPKEWESQRHVAFGVDDEANLNRVLKRWRSFTRRVESLERVLGPSEKK